MGLVKVFNINHKRVYDLMRKNNLTCKKETKNKALRLIKPKPKAQRANQYFGIDMTKVKTPTGWVYITIVLDIGTRKKLSAIISAYKANQGIG